jgi:hypothetical protein
MRWPLEPRLAYPVITEVAPAPDGRHVVYTVREPLLTAEKSEFLTHHLPGHGRRRPGLVARWAVYRTPMGCAPAVEPLP